MCVCVCARVLNVSELNTHWSHCLKLTIFLLQPYRQSQQKGIDTRGQSPWCLLRWRHIVRMVSTQTGAHTEWHALEMVSLTDRRIYYWGNTHGCCWRDTRILVLDQFCMCHHRPYSFRQLPPWQLHSQLGYSKRSIYACVIWGRRCSFCSSAIVFVDANSLLEEPPV